MMPRAPRAVAWSFSGGTIDAMRLTVADAPIEAVSRATARYSAR